MVTRNRSRWWYNAIRLFRRSRHCPSIYWTPYPVDDSSSLHQSLSVWRAGMLMTASTDYIGGIIMRQKGKQHVFDGRETSWEGIACLQHVTAAPNPYTFWCLVSSSMVTILLKSDGAPSSGVNGDCNSNVLEWSVAVIIHLTALSDRERVASASRTVTSWSMLQVKRSESLTDWLFFSQIVFAQKLEIRENALSSESVQWLSDTEQSYLIMTRQRSWQAKLNLKDCRRVDSKWGIGKRHLHAVLEHPQCVPSESNLEIPLREQKWTDFVRFSENAPVLILSISHYYQWIRAI